MSDPWIGDPVADSHGTCSFAHGPGDPKCGAAATVHILSESALHGHVALPACGEHAPVARAAGAYAGEHPYVASCAGGLTLWRGDHCDPIEAWAKATNDNQPEAEHKPEDAPAEIPAMEEWIEGREAWLADGVAKGYVCSEVRCATHDGTPLTPAEEMVFEDGYDDPCIPIVRLANEPGERFIPRFGS